MGISRGPLFALAAALIVAIGVVIFAQRRTNDSDGGVWYAGGPAAARTDSAAAPRTTAIEDTASGRLPAATPAPAMDMASANAARVARRDSARRDSVRRDSVRREADRVDAVRRDSVRRVAARRDSVGRTAEAPDSIDNERVSPRAAGACATPTNAAQRSCLMAAIDRNDADLNRTYQTLIAGLRRDAGGVREPPAVQALRVEQRAWLVQRDRACQRTAAAGSGALWAEALVPCFARMSEEREAVLRERLDQRAPRDTV